MGEQTDIQIDLSGAGLAHVEQYLGGWAMHAPALELLAGQVAGMDLAAHVQAATALDAEPEDPEYEIRDGVAVIELTGVMTKRGSSLFRGYPGSLRLRRRVRQAGEDPEAKGALLLVDSPGGTVNGTFDLAEDVYELSRRKPTVALIEDMGASGAYAVASQAGLVLANSSAAVGSIGVYTVLRDTSERAGKAGIIVHVVRSGAYKGVGVDGAPISEAELTDMEREINETNEVFIETVARGRGMDVNRVRKLADGRVHVGRAAERLGLVDGIAEINAALGRVLDTPVRGAERPARVAMTENRTMSTKPDETAVTDVPAAAETPPGQPAAADGPAEDATKPATLAGLKAALPASDAEFRERCIEGGLTLEAARSLWSSETIERLNGQVEGMVEQVAEMEAKLKAATDERDQLKAQMGAGTRLPGQAEPVTAGPQGGAGADRGRSGIIARGRAAYAAQKADEAQFGKMPVTEARFVNGALIEQGQGTLSEAEIAEQGIENRE